MSKTGGMDKRKEILSIHLPYEINMFRLIDQRLQSPIDNQAIANVLIEGFALHARNLIDFFWDNLPLNAKDAVSRHFTDGAYHPFGGIDPKKIGAYGKINKQISHITYDRTDIQIEKLNQLDRRTLSGLIEEEIKNFVQHIKSPYRQEWEKVQLVPIRTPPPARTEAQTTNSSQTTFSFSVSFGSLK